MFRRKKLYVSVTIVVILAATTCGAIVAIVRPPKWYTDMRVHQLVVRVKESSAFPERIKAIYHVGEMGKDAEPAVDTLIVILDDEKEDPYIRSSAAIALGKIGDERAVTHIGKWRKQMEAGGRKDTSHFKACEWALAKMKKD